MSYLWLRMNAGGVLNTCKSNEALHKALSGFTGCKGSVNKYYSVFKRG